jgi:phosphoribosylaminoimidazole-succinocarboxamide synthase
VVLGVDPGTCIVGFAVILAGPRPVMREFGAIRLRSRDPLASRLGQIHRALGEIISRHRPAVVAVEEVFYGKNFQSAIKIGEARGVTLLAGAMAGVPVVEYSPAMVKKAVTGNGRADKRQVQRMVARLLGIRELPEPLDASDALAIAFCHASRLGRGAFAPDSPGAETPLQKAIRSLKNSRKKPPFKRRTMNPKSPPVSPPARPDVVTQSDLPGLRLIGRGKVRDLYDAGEHLLLLATDRLSAFDVVLPDPIPDKGKVLTLLSVFWFETLGIPNHLVTADPDRMPAPLAPFKAKIRDRALLVRRLEVFPIECVVRGYLAGSGWSEYRERGSVCGVPLPKGLVESDRLPEPIFTPTTKAAAGHDEPMTFEEVEERVGGARAEELREKSIEVYRRAAEHAQKCGIIICDTKFEWGIPRGAPAGDPRAAPAVLADEVLTPDSSRFWPKDGYRPGRSQPSFDKQYVRDYLLTLKWDKRPPGPRLPAEVIERTSQKYREIYERLTGRSWA